MAMISTTLMSRAYAPNEEHVRWRQKFQMDGDYEAPLSAGKEGVPPRTSTTGEVRRRVSGKTVGAFLRDELAAPLGLDCHMGST